MEVINDHSVGQYERRLRRDFDDNAPVNFSQIRRPSRPSIRTKVSGRTATMGSISPPPTPPQALFHNYLRALYSFDPAAHASGTDAEATASIEPGDLILVHSVHANGWADGTVLTSGARGWLPTNYCEPFSHPYMSNLLNAITQFWDLLGAGTRDNGGNHLAAFVRQDYIRGLIAGVRSLLEHADCLHRDAPPVQRHAGIRRMRKGLLADLSSLVQIAKSLQDTIGEPYANEVIHVLLEELISKAFKVVTRAVGFLDMWTQETEEARHAMSLSVSSSATTAVSQQGDHNGSVYELPADEGSSTATRDSVESEDHRSMEQEDGQAPSVGTSSEAEPFPEHQEQQQQQQQQQTQSQIEENVEKVRSQRSSTFGSRDTSSQTGNEAENTRSKRSSTFGSRGAPSQMDTRHSRRASAVGSREQPEHEDDLVIQARSRRTSTLSSRNPSQADDVGQIRAKRSSTLKSHERPSQTEDAVVKTHSRHSSSFAPREQSIQTEDGSEKASSKRSSTYAVHRESTRIRPQSGLVAHRLSIINADPTQAASLASSQLAKAHDGCISHIGAFIGLHLHLRPAVELVATTDRLVEACEKMLKIVDQVASHDPQQSTSVQTARKNFQSQLDSLIQSTKDAFRFSDGPSDEVLMMPDQSNHLVNVGTSLIRTVGDCVVKTRSLIEHIGDFSLDQEPVMKTDPIEDAESLSDGRSASSSEQPAEIKPLEIPTGVRPLHQRSMSHKVLPPIPPSKPLPVRMRASTVVEINDFAMPSPALTLDTLSPITPVSADLKKSLPPVPAIEPHVMEPVVEAEAETEAEVEAEADAVVVVEEDELANKSSDSGPTETASPVRKMSFGTSMSGSTDTRQNSARDSGITAVSEGSTRATTPDQSRNPRNSEGLLISSFKSVSSLRSNTDASSDAEAQLLQKTYANELTFNKEGQVTGGSLPALVERLTAHDNAPDMLFLAAFFTTFRFFTTPRDLVQVLIDRFEYVGDSKQFGTPVRLRICNLFKGWLETYWNAEADRTALGDIRFFAIHKVKPHLPTAGERLIDLTRRVTLGYQNGSLTAPLVSGVGKSSTSLSSQAGRNIVVPDSIVNKNQLSLLRNAATQPGACSPLDFDPLELARQLTLLASNLFNLIQPEELLSLEWSRKGTAKATNVRNLCMLNTDLAHVVADSILTPDDAKKRAVVIKHWTKVAVACEELNNFESLMAIMCSLNSSVVQRLRRTWDAVSKKTKARMDHLNAIVDISSNHKSLRRLVDAATVPCLPFLGVYLTDLTFIDAGNPKTRDLPGVTSPETGKPVSVINFDKHHRMARVVSHLQTFQVPYPLAVVPEMQTWLEACLERMRASEGTETVTKLHRRSLVVEPKKDDDQSYRHRVGELKRSETSLAPLSESSAPPSRSRTATIASVKVGDERPKFDFFLKSKTVVPPMPVAIAETVEVKKQ